MIKLTSMYTSDEILVNPDQVLLIRRTREYQREVNKYFWLAGYVTIEFAFGHEGEPYTEVVIGDIEKIRRLLGQGQASFYCSVNEALWDAVRVASSFSVKPDRSLHPGVKWEDMNDSSRMAAHSTAQQISLLIEGLIK